MLRLSAIVVMLLALAFGAWSLLWNAAAHKSGALLDAWIANEAQLGREWTCASRRIGGYPLDIRLSCADLQFHGEVVQGNFSGSLGGFRAVASVLQPDRVSLQLDPPFAGTTPDGDVDLRFDWSSLGVIIEGRPGAMTRLSVDGAEFAVSGSAGSLGAFDAKARSVHASIAPAAAGGALDFDIALAGADIPLIAVPLGLEAPLDAAAAGVILRVDAAGSGNFAARLERWRAAGGQIELKTARLASGAAKLSATGVLDLDAGRRPHGQLDASFEGLTPILRRLGVDPQILAASSLLTRFLRPSAEGTAPDATRLTLRFSDGRLAIGPIRTPLQLPPLY